MTIYITPDNKLYDDDNGRALGLLPKNARIATKEELDSILNPQETPEQTLARLEGVLDKHLDDTAKTYRYFSIASMCDYRDDPNPKFNSEGKAAYAWRSAVYTLGVNLIGEVQSGLREVPTEEELLALMPKLEDFVIY